MRQFIGLLILLAFLYGARRLFDYYEQIQRKQARLEDVAVEAPKGPAMLPGFRPGFEAQLETGLAEAKRQGALGVKKWLKDYRAYVNDPRLAEIELDLVILLGPVNRIEARGVLAGIGRRIDPSSLVYERFKKLEKVYQ